MRHCKNEAPEVYESSGDNLAELLRDAAGEVESIGEDASFFTVTVGPGFEEAYIVTLFAH